MAKVKQPSLTKVLHPQATSKDRIRLLKEQINELKAQKVCYDKMIMERKRVIWVLERKREKRT